MKSISLHRGVLRLCALLFAIPQAGALESVTWVSTTTGNDANTCVLGAPCQSFLGAYSKTAAGGVINVLTSGFYGSVTIDKSIQIVAPDGVEALATYMPISAGAAGVVKLRGLTFKQDTGQGSAILLQSARALHVENCIINVQENKFGIVFGPTAASELYVSDTIISDINGVDGAGIQIEPTGPGAIKVMLDRVQVKNNNRGIVARGLGSGSLNVTLRDSTVSGNTQTGVQIVKNAGSSGVSAMIERTAVTNNGTGVLVFGTGATARIASSTVAGNGLGLSVSSGGALLSFGNNNVAGNNNNGAPTGMVPLKKDSDPSSRLDLAAGGG